MTQSHILTIDEQEALDFWYNHILDKGIDTPPLEELIEGARFDSWRNDGEIFIHGYIVSVTKMLYLKYYYDKQA